MTLEGDKQTQSAWPERELQWVTLKLISWVHYGSGEASIHYIGNQDIFCVYGLLVADRAFT